MSKINAVRIINLNYNNNTIRISDEQFQMQGRSTLMSLQNGGGKSVFVQMLCAPFVHKIYRNAKDRPFESYFTTSKPTFILVEWKLDRGAGYCLTGMMVRRSQLTEDDNEEKLEMVNFICEYGSRCEQDIYNLPVVEKNNKEILLKGFRECRQLFEKYKKDRTLKFNYYDMNNSAQSRQYFDKLAEYQIYYKEWENIIKKVNQKESGLSELFINCRDEKQLIEEWFISTVENKLKREKDRMKEFQRIIEKYVVSYKANKSKIERRNTINQFKEDSVELSARAGDYKNASDKVEGQENNIAGFRELVLHMESEENAVKEALFAEKKECEEALARTEYERYSYEIIGLMEQQRYHVGNRDMYGMERDALGEEMNQIETLLHKMELAKQGAHVEELRREDGFIRERLKVLHEGESQLEPERKALGKALASYYKQLLCIAEEQIGKNEAANHEEADKIQEYSSRCEALNEKIIDLITRISTYKERMNGFNRIEDTFNADYQENYARNIMGEYEAGYLDIKDIQYKKELEETRRSCIMHRKQLDAANEKQKSLLRDIEDKREKHIRQEAEQSRLEREKEDFEKELAQRLIIMRYLGVEAKEQWDMEHLLMAADRKLAECEQVRRTLEKEEDTLQKEFVRLTQGKVLELPDEIEELLGSLNIRIVYGMEWLKKNGYSQKENEELVRRQPFLPYALIMSKQDMKVLSSHDKEIYTSFPIPIISRERLEEAMTNQGNGLLELQGISFFVWFNEKLLDEEALRLLVAEKECQIREKKEQAAVRKKEYEEYFEKKEQLKNQKLTKALYDKNVTQLSEIKAELEALEKAVSALKNEEHKNSENINELSSAITKEQASIEKMQKREQSFALFCKEYAMYLECMEQAARSQKEQERCEQNRKLAQEALDKSRERLKTIESERMELDKKAQAYKDKDSIYAAYCSDSTDDIAQDIQIPETPQEQEIRFEAITAKMSVQVQDLEQQAQKAAANLNKALRELERLKKKYSLMESDWAGIVYTEQEEAHQEQLLENKRNKFRLKEKQWNDEDKETAVCDSQIKSRKKDMFEKCGMEEPLPIEEIKTTEFQAAVNQIQFQMESLEKDIAKSERRLQGLGENLSTLAEYEDFQCRQEPQWETDPTLLDNKGLRDFQGKLLRDYRNLKEERVRKKGRLTDYLNQLLRREIYQEDYYRKPLEAILSLVDSAPLVLAQIDTTLQSYDSQMEKLAVDISLVEKEKERITELLGDYCKEVHQNLGQIDSNSTITVREKPIKMLRLQLPDWAQQEGMYQLKLNDFLDDLTIKGVEILEKNENPQDYFSARITTKNLYDSVVGIGNVQIKLYKIEAQKEYPITWAQAARNSGGEGFLTAFVVLSSLMYYMRRDDTDLFADKNEGKVLVMDNPFAQTNATHLLKPLIDMADKMNTQLICFTGLSGDSIYSRFDNIYVMNLVASSLKGGMQYLRGEHLRGTEEETIASTQIEVVEQQSLLF